MDISRLLKIPRSALHFLLLTYAHTYQNKHQNTSDDIHRHRFIQQRPLIKRVSFVSDRNFQRGWLPLTNVDVNGDAIDAIIIATPISIGINRGRERLIKVSRRNAKYDASLKISPNLRISRLRSGLLKARSLPLFPSSSLRIYPSASPLHLLYTRTTYTRLSFGRL